MKRISTAQFSARALSISCLVFIFLVTPAILQAQQSASLPTILSFEIHPTTVEDLGGEWIEFSWRTKDVDRVRLYRDGQEIKGRSQLRNGEFGFPTLLTGGFKTEHSKSATYELVAENEHGKATKTIVVPAAGTESVPPPYRPKIVSFRASPTLVEAGKNVKIFWEVKDAETVRFFDDHGELESPIQLHNGKYGWPLTMPGAFSTTQNKTTTYKLVAKNREGKIARKSFTVRVKASQLKRTLTIRQKSNGRYLDAHEGSNDNSVVTRDRQNNNTQRWILKPL
jgi:hypothetical protein